MRHLPPTLSYAVNVTYYRDGRRGVFTSAGIIGMCDCHGFMWQQVDLLADDMGRSIICPITRWMNERPNDFYPGI